MRKQLKLPSIEYIQIKEIAENEYKKEEMLKLIIEKKIQIRKMEEQIEELLKEKKQHMWLMIQSQQFKYLPHVYILHQH